MQFKYIDYINLINPNKINNRKNVEEKFRELAKIAKQKQVKIIINHKEFKVES